MSIFKVVWISDPLELEGRTFSYLEEAVLVLVPRPREDAVKVSSVKKSRSKAKEIFSQDNIEQQQLITFASERILSTSTSRVSFESVELLPVETPFHPTNPLSSTFEPPSTIFESDLLPFHDLIPMRSEPPIGISNMGNTCYANSVIQMLFRIPNIRKIIGNLQVYHGRAHIRAQKLVRIAEDLTQKGHAQVATKFIRKFEDLVGGIRLAEGLNHMFHQLQTNNQFEPATFTKSPKCLQALPGIFSRNDQEDADEYLIAILSALKDILPRTQQDYFSIRLLRKGVHKSLNGSKTVNTSSIDTLNRISLPLVDGIENISELIEEELKTDVKDLKFESDGSPGCLIESKSFLNLPEFLPIQLQRLVYTSNGLKKISRPIRAPELLDLSRFSHSSDSLYKLEMFLEHRGGPHGGHYLAYSKDGSTGRWHEFNDDKVQQIPNNLAEVKMTTAYIYFYRKM